jgi:hypothetical protein
MRGSPAIEVIRPKLPELISVFVDLELGLIPVPDHGVNTFVPDIRAELDRQLSN